MAMQTGMGLSRIIIVLGAGYTGTIILKNNKLSDIIGEILSLVKSREGKGESSEEDYTDAIATQVRLLAAGVRDMASARQITVVNPSGQIDLSSLIMPAAALGAFGYGYMWWKGLSFSDIMYVTKHNMAAAVSSLKENLEGVSTRIKEVKAYLANRMDGVDLKLADQLKLSDSIKNDVSSVRTDLTQVGGDLKELKELVYGLDDRMNLLDEKQEFANVGIAYLCNFVEGKKTEMPSIIQEQLKISGTSRGYLTAAGTGLKGLKGIADSLELGDEDESITRIAMKESVDNFNSLPKRAVRMLLTKC